MGMGSSERKLCKRRNEQGIASAERLHTYLYAGGHGTRLTFFVLALRSYAST